MQKFSIAPNGLSDGKRECKADHKNNCSIASENKLLETFTLAKKYENTGTEATSGEAIKENYPIICNSCSLGFGIAAQN